MAPTCWLNDNKKSIDPSSVQIFPRNLLPFVCTAMKSKRYLETKKLPYYPIKGGARVKAGQPV